MFNPYNFFANIAATARTQLDYGVHQRNLAWFAQVWPPEKLEAALKQITKVDKKTFDEIFNEYAKRRLPNLFKTPTDDLVEGIAAINEDRGLDQAQKEAQIAGAIKYYIRNSQERGFCCELISHSGKLIAASARFNEETQKSGKKSDSSVNRATSPVITRLKTQLRALGLDYQAVPGDGHCLYHAVALYLDHGEDQMSLRKIVAAHIEDHLSEFSAFIERPAGKTVKDYLNDVRQGKEWASHVEIEVLMRVLNRPIVVIGSEGNVIDSDALRRFSGEPIFVYYNGTSHYDALIRSNKNITAQQIVEQLMPANQSSDPKLR